LTLKTNHDASAMQVGFMLFTNTLFLAKILRKSKE